MTVEASRVQRLRKAWFQVHKWIALALMILLIPLGLTGIILTWDDAIDHGLNPQRYAVSGSATLAPSRYVAAAQSVLGPNDRFAMMRYPGHDGGPVVLSAQTVAPGEGHHRGPPKRINVWLDPPIARILDHGSADDGLIRLAHNFHGNLFLPGVGRAITGVLGIAMFLLAATGIWLWWPPMGRWTRGFRWQRGDRKVDTNLHHQIGFWIALPLAVQAFTGAWIASPQMIALLGGGNGGGGGGGRMRAAPIANPHLAPDAALATAVKLAPGTPLSINWPAGEDGPWRVSIKPAKGPPANIEIDDQSGGADIADQPDDRGGLAMTMRHWHDGTTGGFFWKIVMVFIGLGPTVLGVTGVLMWLRTRRWRNRKPLRAEPESVAA